MTTLAQNREPSLRTRQPSSSKRPSPAATSSSCAGQPRATASRRIEAREVLADDLVGPVALEPLGPGVPGEDVASRVEHEDRVVPDALDEEPKALLALPQFFCRGRLREPCVNRAWRPTCALSPRLPRLSLLDVPQSSRRAAPARRRARQRNERPGRSRDSQVKWLRMVQTARSRRARRLATVACKTWERRPSRRARRQS